MSKRLLVPTMALVSLVATPAVAGGNTFQNTCSEIHFAYQGNNPTIQAVCLRANGTASETSLVLQGISNQNGQLTQGTSASTFQQSCGNMQLVIGTPQISTGGRADVTLTAFCRNTSGYSVPTSLPLNNIVNINGTLVQQ
jgi:hypothetical protein